MNIVSEPETGSPAPADISNAAPLLVVDGLRTYFDLRHGVVKAVDGVSFALAPHETLAIVGESGCGKSITALSLMRLVPDPPGRIAGGSIKLAGVDLLALSDEAMRDVRGNDIAMIFQEPMTSLNPVLTIGSQIAEVLLLHEPINRKQARAKAIDMLRLARIPEPEQRAREYPHQLSGGMRQRAMIAMALACNPKVLIADEPTTALDVTIQAQILDIIDGPAAQARHRHHPDHPRSRRGGGDRAARHRHVCRAQGGGGAGRRVVRAAAASLYARADGLDPAPAADARGGRQYRRTPAGNPRHGAGLDRPAGRAASSRRAAPMPRIAAARDYPALRGEAAAALGGVLALRRIVR